MGLHRHIRITCMPTCTRCGVNKLPDEFYQDKSKPTGRRNHCKKCVNARTRVKRADDPGYYTRLLHRLKSECFDLLGGTCACCGESERRFLTFDHVNEDGKAHRGKTNANYAIWRDIRAGKNDYEIQILCANCHLAKRGPGKCSVHREEE